ncbi:predicted protein, partial [Nematostella vectensis]
PLLPRIDDVPWCLNDVSKVLRLGRAREHFRAISPQTIERISFMLQRPLLRIVREARRLALRHERLSKAEIQTSVRLVLSLSMSRSCAVLASKALSMYSMCGEPFLKSKRARSGLVFPVGRIFRWLLDMKVACRVYDAAAIYLAATLEYIAEETIYRAVTTREVIDHVVPETVEKCVNMDPDLWSLYQPYCHLLSGRTCYGIVETLEPYAVTKVKRTLSPSLERSPVAPKTHKPLEPCFVTTCVTSISELKELIAHVQKRLGSESLLTKDNRALSSLAWLPVALQTLLYFMTCSHQVDVDITGILANTKRSHSHLPPLVEWIRVASIHAEHRASGVVDDDDVRQAARLLMPFTDCEPRLLSSQCWSPGLSPSASIAACQFDMGLRMLLCGKRELAPQALTTLGPEKINAIDQQGMTPLMHACAQGDVDLVKLLLDNHAYLDSQVPHRDAQRYPQVAAAVQGWTAICYAVMIGHVYICQMLLDAGANPNASQGTGADAALQLAVAAGHYDLVSLLCARGADPHVTWALGPGKTGFGSTFATAAACGHRKVLRKLLAEPPPARDSDMMSLEEILSEGSPVSKGGNSPKLNRKRMKVLQEAMYHSSEHGFVEIAMELRSLGVPWSLHCWTQTLYHAYEQGQTAHARCLFRDFQSIPVNEYTVEFCEDGLAVLFHIFRECEDLSLMKDLASVFSACFGDEPLPTIEELPSTAPKIRIGADYVNNQEMSDVTFVVEGEPFYGHKIILATASPRFKQMLTIKPSENSEGHVPCIEITDIKYDIFTHVIRYVYSGKTQDPQEHWRVLELMHAAHYFMLAGLRRHCERLTADRMNVTNAIPAYKCAKCYEAKELLEYCECFMLANLETMIGDKTLRDLVLGEAGRTVSKGGRGN